MAASADKGETGIDMADELIERKLSLRFDQLDTDSDGYLTEADFHALAQRLIAAFGIEQDSPKAQAVLDGQIAYWDSLVERADVDSDGRVDRGEFVAALGRALENGEFDAVFRPEVSSIVELADVDGDGHADLDEFVTALRAMGVAEDDSRRLFPAADADGDGRISVQEWVALGREFYTSTDADAVGSRLLGRVPA